MPGTGKPIVLFSGGLDSTTLLLRELQKGEVKALSFNYGQRHAEELDVALKLTRKLKIEHVIVDLGSTPVFPFYSVAELIQKGSQTGSEPVPLGHYTEPSMKTTIVPNRNMIMISIAVGWAVATDSERVLWAAHAGDHAIYPDCRPDFLYALREAINQGNAWDEVHLDAPFIYLSKAEIVKMGQALGVPFAETYSCYQGRPQHCGRCGTCVERKEAFQLAGVPDPTQYEEVQVG
jgi:7-cyano-7-deazaguanine synthase